MGNIPEEVNGVTVAAFDLFGHSEAFGGCDRDEGRRFRVPLGHRRTCAAVNPRAAQPESDSRLLFDGRTATPFAK